MVFDITLRKKLRKAQMQNGQYTAHVAPLGYIKDPHDKHKLVIGEQGARIVRRFSEMVDSMNIDCSL